MKCEMDVKWQEISKEIELLKPIFYEIENLKNKEISLFGAGRYGRVALTHLKKLGYKINCFIDNAPQKQGTKIDGIQVVPINHPLIKSSEFILTTIKGSNYKIDGISSMSFDAWYIVKNIDKYERIRNNLLLDDKSQKTLDGILLSFLTNDKSHCKSVMDFNQYFCIPEFRNTWNEHFVDVGAYVGDSIEKFIWVNDGVFKHIYAFEPGEKPFKALKKRTKRLIEEWALAPDTISLFHAGVSDVECYADINEFQSNEPNVSLVINKIKDRKSKLKMHTLDNKLQNFPVTFIKADIEGMEMDMLKGAKQTILNNKPKIALCVYHNINDLIDSIEFLQNIVPEYKMALRHHSPSLAETVLYCWTEK